MKVVINCKNLLDREQAHEYLAQMLDFPEYYGKNLDALFDCLTELSDCTIVLVGQESLSPSSYGARVQKVLKAAAQANSGLKLEEQKMKLLYGTSNPAKLSSMRRRLTPLGIELIGLKDLNSEIPKVIEDGATPLENARKKAAAYFSAFHIPVFSCDSGLYIENLPDELQPGVNVRTINGKYLTDEEMIAYYSSLAQKYGDLKAFYRNAICFVKDENLTYEAMNKSMESEPFIITSIPHKNLNKGFPLDSLSIDIKTGKYYNDLDSSRLDTVAVEDGFLEFFRKVQECEG